MKKIKSILNHGMHFRFERIDALRGTAMIWMTIFHCCFDLNYFGFWKQNFYTEPIWILQRTCIVFIFLFCAGLAQAAAHIQRVSWTQFMYRWLCVIGCAGLVSAASYVMFPPSFIYFGVLHGIAVMQLILKALGNQIASLLCLIFFSFVLFWCAPFILEGSALAPVFNSPAFNWIGFITTKPITEDYLPLLPWLGVMAAGMATGLWTASCKSSWLERPLPKGLRPLARLGRYSLSYYMLHQPVMIASLWLLTWLLH